MSSTHQPRTATLTVHRAILAIALALFLAGCTAHMDPGTGAGPLCDRSDNGCIAPGDDPARQSGAPLFQPYEIAVSDGELSTALEARYFSDVLVDTTEMTGLRLYGYENPDDGSIYACPSTNEYCYTLPGPTFRLRKGDEFFLNLRNNLGDAPVAVDDGTGCNLENQPSSAMQSNGDPKFPDDVFPNCYHENNVTNFHFHGFHISPEPPHDNIFLKLQPGKQYDLNSGVIPPNQAEGTHWYHPHHHGATALQVSNGMAGAFIVEGEFDDWLNAFYSDDLEEKILIIQEIHDVVPFAKGPQNRVRLLVNGQKDPVLEIDVGEIQRWRFLDATSNNLSDLEVFFSDNTEVRQIAMDGVQFATSNYCEQPLLTDAQTNFCTNNNGVRDGNISLAPGNRADFLVKGIGAEGSSRAVQARLDLPEQPVEAIRERFNLSRERETFLTVKMGPTPRTEAMEFPDENQWPPLPGYLANIDDDDILQPPTEVVYSMTGTTSGNPIVNFYIDHRKFDPACVDQRMALDTAEEWRFTNITEVGDEPLQHPAHIHVNPFQVLKRDGVDHPNDDPIWQDVIALPKSEEENATVIRQRFDDFEGMFVMHCHFLGHEDRGMMQTLEIGDQSGCRFCPSPANQQCTDYRASLASPPGIKDLD